MERNNEKLSSIDKERRKWINYIFIAILFMVLGFFSTVFLIKNYTVNTPLISLNQLYKPIIYKIDLFQNNKNKVERRLMIRIDKNKKVYMKRGTIKITYKNLNYFEKYFKNELLRYSKNLKIVIRADERLVYKDVLLILRLLKEAGFKKVSIMTP